MATFGALIVTGESVAGATTARVSITTTTTDTGVCVCVAPFFSHHSDKRTLLPLSLSLSSVINLPALLVDLLLAVSLVTVGHSAVLPTIWLVVGRLSGLHHSSRTVHLQANGVLRPVVGASVADRPLLVVAIVSVGGGDGKQ